MRNRYPDKCTKCGKTVASNHGEANKVHGRWLVIHDECNDQYTGRMLRAEMARMDEDDSQKVKYENPQRSLKL
jgi:hypothetical protein